MGITIVVLSIIIAILVNIVVILRLKNAALLDVLCRLKGCLNLTTATFESGIQKLEDHESAKFFRVTNKGLTSMQVIIEEQLAPIIDIAPHMDNLIKHEINADN